MADADDLDLIDDDEDEDLEPAAADAPPALRKAHREEQKRRKEAERELDRYRQRERELAFREAGIGADTPQAEALSKLHDGEWTAEAVQATVERFGLAASDPAPVDDTPDPAAEATARVDRLRSASQPVPVEPDPVTKAQQYLADGDVSASITTKVQAIWPPEERMLEA